MLVGAVDTVEAEVRELVRRRGLDPSRLTLRRTGGRGGVAGRFAARTGFAALARVAGFVDLVVLVDCAGLVVCVGLVVFVPRGWPALGCGAPVACVREPR